MNELQKVFNYGETPVRTVVEGDTIWFVAKDVCDVLEIQNSRQALTRLDEDEKDTVTLNDGAGNPNKSVVNEYGLYNLILSSRKKEVKPFKRWVTHEVLPSIRETGGYETPQRQKHYLLEVAQEEMGIAELMAKVGGVKIGIASAVAIDRSEKRTGESLAEYKALLPSAEHETGHLNATQVGKKFGLSGMKANKALKEIGLQYQEEYKPGKKQWRLTEVGKEYGEEMPYNRNGHSGYQIKWSNEVLDIMKEQPTAK